MISSVTGGIAWYFSRLTSTALRKNILGLLKSTQTGQEISRRLVLAKQVAKADVCLVSYPKCGRTWLRLMIGKALQLHFDLPESNLLDLYQLADIHSGIPKILVTHDDDPDKEPERLFTSKLLYKDVKVIFLVRDPRDVVVSRYFQVTKRRQTYDGSLQDFLYKAGGSLDTIIRFHEIWAANHHVPQAFLMVRYEDMSANPAHELRRVLNFIGLEQISDEIVDQVVAYCAFENMRKLEAERRFNTEKLQPISEDDENSYKTRKGKIGGYTEYFNEQEIKFLNQRLRESALNFYGYSF
jgi:hypothetical protein